MMQFNDQHTTEELGNIIAEYIIKKRISMKKLTLMEVIELLQAAGVNVILKATVNK